MLQSELTKEQLHYCAEEIKTELSPDIDYDRLKMKKGLNLYRQGHVYNAALEERYITAKVQDDTTIDVTLDLEVFVLSTCSCGLGGICRHKLAVFFYTYGMVDRVGDFFQNWQDNKNSPLGTTSPKELHKEEEEKVEIGEKVRNWYTFFKKQYHLYKEKQKHDRFTFNQLFLFESIYKAFFQGLKSYAPATPFIKDLYLIHAATFTMQKLVEESEHSKLSLSSKDSYVYPYVSELLNVVYARLLEIKNVAVPLSAENLLIDTKDQMTQLLFCGNEYQYERLMAYFMVWNAILNRKEWIEEDRAMLEKRREEYVARKQSFAVECQFALAHLSYLQKDDQEALHLLSQIKGNLLRYCYFWSGNLQAQKEWDRQSKWLNFSLELLQEHNGRMIDFHSKRSITRQFLPLYAENARQTNDSADIVRVMKSLLPYSYSEFDDYLLELEDYQMWTELQMLVGYGIADQPRDILKQIEKIDPKVLLPLYHKAVNDAIRERNRPSYKLAVRYLKKLRTYYKKLKQVDRWNDFIVRLAAEHKRLRALQEELERGKLLHD